MDVGVDTTVMLDIRFYQQMGDVGKEWWVVIRSHAWQDRDNRVDEMVDPPQRRAGRL